MTTSTTFTPTELRSRADALEAALVPAVARVTALADTLATLEADTDETATQAGITASDYRDQLDALDLAVVGRCRDALTDLAALLDA